MTRTEIQLANKPVLSSQELERVLNAKGIFLVPVHEYEKFQVLASHFESEVAKMYIRGKLLQYIEARYPGKALVNFAEVQGNNGKYQMWIQLLNEGETTFDGTMEFENSLKQLSL